VRQSLTKEVRTVAQFTILGICGSLRRSSYNRLLLLEAQELAPPDVAIEEFAGLREIPPYDDDVRVGEGDPPPVAELKRRIALADALLIATPEYNFGPPGVLKNAIDWVSRPPLESPLRHKAIALMGASTGRMGTVRAQLALRQNLAYLESYVLLKPEVLVSGAATAFDEAGRLVDETTRALVGQLVTGLVAWTRKVAM
jgi:chromate reductase